MSHVLALWLLPAVIVGVMIYLHRSTHRRLDCLEGRLDSRIGGLEKRIGRLEELMARLEGTLDVLREFFVGSGCGTAA